MNTYELTALIGECISMEIDEVIKVEYIKESNEPNSFTIMMENGKRFLVNVTKI